MAQQKKTTEKKKARIYSTKIIDEIMEDRKRGFIGDTDPFFEGEVEFRAANILFQLTDEEKASYEQQLQVGTSGVIGYITIEKIRVVKRASSRRAKLYTERTFCSHKAVRKLVKK